MTEERGAGRAVHGLRGPRIAAGVLVVVSALLVLSAIGIARGGGYSVVGPATIPLGVAIGLLVLSAILAVRTTVAPDLDLAASVAEEERSTHWPSAVMTLVLLLAYGLALDGFRLGPIEVPGLGYVIATGLFLPATARVLGSRSPVRDLILGFAIAVLLYVAFTEFLGVRLPPGLLDLVL